MSAIIWLIDQVLFSVIDHPFDIRRVVVIGAERNQPLVIVNGPDPVKVGTVFRIPCLCCPG